MKFEVLNREGKVMMWTESPACIPDEETKRSMRRAGYGDERKRWGKRQL